MRLIFFFLFLTLGCGTQVLSQRNPRTPYIPGEIDQRARERLHFGTGVWDIGFNFGTANSLTDLSGRPDIRVRLFLYDTQWRSTNLNAGMFTRFRYSPNLAFVLEYNIARMTAADSLGHRKSRGYSFRNDIFEAAFMAEYYPSIIKRLPLEVYGFVGFALFFNNPKVYLHSGFVHELDDFSRIQPAIPLGAGLKYLHRSNLQLGAKIGWRKLFTNYLDGLATIEEGRNDSYYFISLSLGYRL